MKLARENYVKMNNKSSLEDGKIYTDEFCQKHYKNALKNYDINMKYFASLSKDDFNQELNKFLSLNPKFVEITNLNDITTAGYYMLVLDDYCQVYIGTSGNIKKRVMGHWSKTKEFDRLIFGGIDNSILSIDSFRALDTKRIYAFATNNIFNMEEDLISSFPQKYSLNRTKGGRLEGGLEEAIIHRRTRTTNNKESCGKRSLIQKIIDKFKRF